MQGRLKKLKGQDGSYYIPITHTDAVIDSTGKTLTQKLSEIGTGGSSSLVKPLNGKKAFFFGDSITDWPEGALEVNGFVSLVSVEQGMSFVNYGEAGWTIWSGAGSNGSIADLVVSTDISTADVIFFTGGTNLGSNNIGTIDDATTATTYGALNVVAQKCLNANKILILLTPIQTADGGRTGSRLAGVKLTRQAILDIALKYSLPVFDWYAKSGITQETSVKYLSDNIHPNNEGYRVMAKGLNKFIYNELVV